MSKAKEIKFEGYSLEEIFGMPVEEINITLKQNDGLTALELALKQGFKDIADIIHRHNVQ